MTPIECKSRLSLRLMGAGRFAPQLFLACTATHTLTHGAAAADAQTTSAAAIERAIAVPSTDMLAAHVQFLADDLMAGRAPGSRGASVAARYIRSQFQAAGLEPGAPNGSFFQSVRLIGVTPQPAIVVGIAQRTMALRYLDDFVAWPDGPARGVVSDGEIVFVGYGIDAPEWQWNDYSGESVNGKIVMMLVNDPGLNDSTIFRGREMTRYGHWSYKIDEAARRGAAGVILIHTIRHATYPWSVVRNSWAGERLQLEGRPSRTLRFAAWITEDAARRVIAAAGIDYGLLMRRTSRRDFRPVLIGAHAVVDITSVVRTLESVNVIGRLPAAGEDTDSEESVLLTAHYDHHGLGPPSPAGQDSIYNGAVDNASGVAALLATAAALTRAGHPARRSIYFVATTGHEAGLLGAQTLVTRPPVPLERTAAVINIDRGNVWGTTRDIVALGAELSSLGNIASQAAQAEGLSLTPDPAPELGDYFGSDHFPFALAGVPALQIATGRNFVGQPADWGDRTAENYLTTKYHQPGDEFHAGLSYEGLLQQVAVMTRIAWAVAQTGEFPVWNENSVFHEAGARLRAAR